MRQRFSVAALGAALALGLFLLASAAPPKDGSPPVSGSAAPSTGAQKTGAAGNHPLPAGAKAAPADNSYCYVCHTNYEEESLVHGHQVVGVGCEKCHGPSTKHSGDEDNITPPDRMFAHADVDRFCITCHAEDKLRKNDIHKEWLQDEVRDDTCNDCHGRFHHLAVRTRRWDKHTGKLIADDGVRMMTGAAASGTAAAPVASTAVAAPRADGLFARDNLVAWCIVPFDAKKRGPEERAAMLQQLGFKQLAYDWRAEHVASFDAELDALHRHGIKLTAFWFPGSLNQDARTILNLLKRHHLHTQLWVTRSMAPAQPSVPPAQPGVPLARPVPPSVSSSEAQRRLVEAGAEAIRPIAAEAAKIGCSVELYNHGGWFGEPENQIAIIERLKMPNVGIVYNLHHGHGQLGRFPQLLEQMMPYLHALNLNGMVAGGDRRGMMILPLGQGDLDLGLLKAIRESGYHGPIGILNHSAADAADRLQDNLDGLDWLVAQLDGQPAGVKPVPRTWNGADHK